MIAWALNRFVRSLSESCDGYRRLMMNRFDHCPICNSKHIMILSGFEALYIHKCIDCSFVFDSRIPTEDELYDHYKQYSYSMLKPCLHPTVASYNKLLDELEQYRQSGNILDIGCGQGDFLNEARNRGWNVFGCEYSGAAVSLCHDRDISIQQGALTAEMFHGVQFDVITSFEVIEHINNQNEHFDLVYKKLRHGGLYFCTTPNFDALLRFLERDQFPIICYPEHISFYTKASLSHIARHHGFTIQKILTTGIDIGRLKRQLLKHDADLGRTEKRLFAKAQTDSFREQVESNKLLGLIKKSINVVLSVVRKGDTLKGYLVKP
ncbi:MAG: class I SAM-dependent methyltransferase [Mariprofundus sp.]|nr:class I SAM-dependent methyltransferase [Mariprofundus sp.]